MSSAAKKILEDALALPDEDRRHVAELLIDSLPAASKAEIERAWNEEALWRAEEAENGSPSLDGATVLAELEAKIRRIHSR